MAETHRFGRCLRKGRWNVCDAEDSAVALQTGLHGLQIFQRRPFQERLLQKKTGMIGHHDRQGAHGPVANFQGMGPAATQTRHRFLRHQQRPRRQLAHGADKRGPQQRDFWRSLGLSSLPCSPSS